MKTPKYRSNVSGEGLVIVIILVVLIGGGLWWLVSHKQAVDKEARVVGRDMVKRLAVDHDAAFFANNLSPQLRLDYPPLQQQEEMSKFQQLGAPAQPIQIDESVSWEGPWEFKFFEPKGSFTAHLNYAAGPATLQIAIDHPASKWQLTGYSFSPPRAR